MYGVSGWRFLHSRAVASSMAGGTAARADMEVGMLSLQPSSCCHLAQTDWWSAQVMREELNHMQKVSNCLSQVWVAVQLVTFPLWLSRLRQMAQTGKTEVGLGGRVGAEGAVAGTLAVAVAVCSLGGVEG